MVPNFGHLNISFMGFLSYFYITYIVKLVFSLIFYYYYSLCYHLALS